MTSPTIAKVTTILTLTDGTLRIIETPLDSAMLRSEPVICCQTEKDALEYLAATNALDVNPAWYAQGANDND